MEEVIIRKGEYIFQENDPASKLYLLGDGIIEFTKNKDNLSLG